MACADKKSDSASQLIMGIEQLNLGKQNSENDEEIKRAMELSKAAEKEEKL